MLSNLLSEFPGQLSTVLVLNLVLPIAVITLIRPFAQKLLFQFRLRSLPLINDPGLFQSGNQSKQTFLWNAQGLLDEGFTKASKAFRVETDNAEVLVLSPKYADEIRKDDRFSFTHLLHKDFLGHIPAFINFNPSKGLNDMANDVIQAKVTPSLGLVTEDLSEEGTLTFKDQWTDNPEWHQIHLKTTLLEIVARLSSRVFLGPDICRNPAWLRITIDYTINVFFGVMALKKWPVFIRPLIWRFVPEVSKVRSQIEEAVRIIRPVVDKRMAEHAAGSEKTYNDAIQWAIELSKGRPYDPALLQLGFSLAAIHTTTDLLSQVIYDLCAHPEYIEPMREEIRTVLKEEGMTKPGLFKLKLMDSVIKETQRFKPGAMLLMRRLLLEDVTLSDGTFLPKGVQIGIPIQMHFDESSYTEPEKFDGYRFVKMADDPKKEKFRHLVSTSPDHLGFGHGKHACPGRFFAANEIKIALVHILMKYDFKLPEGTTPAVMKMGWVLSSDSNVQLLVRRRQVSEDVLL
ncbi:cytochrome P450 [Aspergillus affinis]|uniref:cytochrome P450 n=1 Tax=Aspergillus affinis TaxID=1070780 RepID=UPI0022FF1DCB|nr:cytochrome P450 [Aspergillus affinis]KAI9037685.1 cytochrome P450 [Aspergillus affinis]